MNMEQYQVSSIKYQYPQTSGLRRPKSIRYQVSGIRYQYPQTSDIRLQASVLPDNH